MSKRWNRRISHTARFAPSENGLAWSRSRSYSLTISSRMASNLFKTLTHALRSDLGHFHVPTSERSLVTSSIDPLETFLMNSATCGGYEGER